MKQSLLSILIVFLALASCREPAVPPASDLARQSTSSPGPDQTPSVAAPTGSTLESDAVAEPATRIDPRPTPSASAASEDTPGFAVYLVSWTAATVPGTDLDLAQLELEPHPLLSEEDLIRYVWESHEMDLTDSAYDRVRRLRGVIPSVGGLPFVVCVGDERIYSGAFWSSYSSSVYQGIVLDVYPAEYGHPVRFQLGYPSPGWFEGQDLRADSRIRRSLEAVGKLILGAPAESQSD